MEVVGATVASASVDAVPDSASIAPAATCGGTSAACATVLGPAYIGAAPSPTTKLRLAHGAATSSVAVLGLAVAHGATVVPGSAYVHAASAAWTATALELTCGAAVLSGTVLGRAKCAAAIATATACALGLAASRPTAALGLHQVTDSSGAATATTHAAAPTTTSYAAASAASAAAATGVCWGRPVF